MEAGAFTVHENKFCNSIVASSLMISPAFKKHTVLVLGVQYITCYVVTFGKAVYMCVASRLNLVFHCSPFTVLFAFVAPWRCFQLAVFGMFLRVSVFFLLVFFFSVLLSFMLPRISVISCDECICCCRFVTCFHRKVSICTLLET